MSDPSPYATDASRWAAIAGRDQKADGVFLVAVRTTGIYCRPDCPSRMPKRRNVEFFDTRAAAEAAGYRPCKRCRPDAESPRRARARLIAGACRSIEEAEQPPPLKELAAAAGLSPWYFQRQFKEIVGVSPKRYAAAQRDRRFRDRLGAAGSVTEAIYDAGFGSASRAYDGARERLGMTPSAYRDGASGEDIRYVVASCSLGWIAVAATARGICAIEFAEAPEELRQRLAERFPKAELNPGDRRFADWVATVTAFVESPRRGLDLPLDIRGTAFQRRVWEALRKVPPGSTVSYGDLAQRIGQPTAARAVAGACAANPIALAIPCHRAVCADGAPGGYRWGTARKRTLLEREKQADHECQDDGEEDDDERLDPVGLLSRDDARQVQNRARIVRSANRKTKIRNR